MTKFTYKAYLSYSHADTRWAAWLQRALETYRVPRHLSSAADQPALPKRLAPIFRDREDLSSASRLDEGLQEALRASEFMIVLCSPAAAGSRWVNEEIRYFRSLGRPEKILCVLVDGDPETAADSFPSALFEGVSDGASEPLAADPRPYADGKLLAKQKLIAGMLGVRLDAIRRRDLARSRRWRLVGSLAAILVLALAAVTITSRLAEQQQRENAEQMATFIVDLGEDLKSEISLEARAAIGQNAMRYLADLDPAVLSVDTGIRVGLAIRQLGQVSQDQSDNPSALSAFLESRQWFRDLAERFPSNQDVLFELGQAEFYVGYHHFLQQDYATAWNAMSDYGELTQQLYEMDPGRLDWLLELSYARTSTVAMWLESGLPLSEAILVQANEATGLAKELLDRKPGDPELLGQYAGTLAWSADAHSAACDLSVALAQRRNSLEITRQAHRLEPSNRLIEADVAFAHSGLSMVQLQLGLLEEALQHLQESQQLLLSLWQQDLSNASLRQEFRQKTNLLADLLLQLGRVEGAASLVSTLDSEYADFDIQSEDDELLLSDYQDHLVVRAALLHRNGDDDAARMSYLQAMAVSQKRRAESDFGARITQGKIEIAYAYWRLAGEILPEVSTIPLEPRAPGILGSCGSALAMARLAVMQGEDGLVRQEVAFMQEHGYAAPAFLAFCSEHGQCQQ